MGGSPENVESLLLTLAKSYVPEVAEMESVTDKDIAEPVLLPDKGIWHPVADKVFENPTEYLAWYNKVCITNHVSGVYNTNEHIWYEVVMLRL